MAKKKTSGDELQDFMKKSSTPKEMKGVKRIKSVGDFEKILLARGLKPEDAKFVVEPLRNLSKKDRDGLLESLLITTKK